VIAKGKWEVGCQLWPGPFTVPCTDPNTLYVQYIARFAVSRKDFKKNAQRTGISGKRVFDKHINVFWIECVLCIRVLENHKPKVRDRKCMEYLLLRYAVHLPKEESTRARYRKDTAYCS